MKKKYSSKKSAFSLIELSIVLIIIGLLIAGVTGGASLIKSSELRAVASEARAFTTSINGFYNQFNAYPGDYTTAISGSSTGDGDNTIEYGSGGGGTASEGRNAWVQMKAAGIIDSNVLSAATSVVATTTAASFGSSVPASKIKSSGWDLDYNATSGVLQNVLVLTGATGTYSSGNTLVNGTSVAGGAITPTDALSVDTKIDDGVANTGKVRGVTSTTGTCNSSGTYSTSTTTKVCALSYQVDINS